MAFTRNKGFKIGYKDHLICQIVGPQLNVYVDDTNEHLWFDTLEDGAGWVITWMMNHLGLDCRECERPFNYTNDTHLVPKEFQTAISQEISKLK